MSYWTEHRLEVLNRRWSDGATGQEIAQELGLSRSAVHGKIHRLGLKRAQIDLPLNMPRRARPRMGREEARTASEAYQKQQRGKGSHVRKAYAALGDDTTFSRFVKVKGERVHKPKQLSTDARHPAFVAGRSIFHRNGIKHPNDLSNLLVSGHSNVKIGRDVRRGFFRGYWIYVLSLEERATCPRTCHNWTSCYGNNMPYASRVDHSDPKILMQRLEEEIRHKLGIRDRAGMLVRLHALGDFFSIDYVWFWGALLAAYPNLAIYGYTARKPKTGIGVAISALKRRFGRRFAIRWSDGGLAEDCTVTILSADQCPPNAFVCPEQTGRSDGCGKCGACWTGTKNVAFITH